MSSSDRMLLVQGGLVTEAGEIIGVETPTRDAPLLALLGRLKTLDDTYSVLIDRDCRHETVEWIHSNSQEMFRLAEAISNLRARTKLGLIAKLTFALESMDPKGTGARGSVLRIPVSAVRDALAFMDDSPSSLRPPGE